MAAVDANLVTSKVEKYQDITFLAHLSQRLKVSYCHPFLSVVHRASCIVRHP